MLNKRQEIKLYTRNGIRGDGYRKLLRRCDHGLVEIDDSENQEERSSPQSN